MMGYGYGPVPVRLLPGSGWKVTRDQFSLLEAFGLKHGWDWGGNGREERALTLLALQFRLPASKKREKKKKNSIQI